MVIPLLPKGGSPLAATIMGGKYWDKAWSLVDGCTPVSESCEHCWLLAMGNRFHANCCPPRFREDRIGIPIKRKKPTIWCIWSDLFHESITASQIISAFEVMSNCPQHTFIVCTKRPERIASVLYGPEGNYYLGGGDYWPNIILMTTTETQEWADRRIPELIKCSPFQLAVSIEPLLSLLSFRWASWRPIRRDRATDHLDGLRAIDWVVLGGESGPGARYMDPDWARSIRDECKEAGTPLWMKQMSGRNKVPDDLMIREYPLYVYNQQFPWRRRDEP